LPTLPTASPESQGMSAERLARIDRFLNQKYVAPGLLPAAQLLVARNGAVVHQSVLGHAVLPAEGVAPRPMAEDTIVRIYSMTKPITSVAFMMLVEEGLVALDDPVHRFIPAWRNLGVYVGGGAGVPGAAGGGWLTKPTDEPMRMIDLLRHTSGLTYGFQMRTMVDAAYRQKKVEPFEVENAEGGPGLQGFVDALAQIPLEFSPGSAFNYSVSTDVLGYLVEKISGQPFAEFLQQRILGPLGMVDTAFHVPEDKLHRFTECYTVGGDGKLAAAVQGWPSFKTAPAAPSGTPHCATSASSCASSSAPCRSRWVLSTSSRRHSASSELDLPGNISRAISSVSVTRATRRASGGCPSRASSASRKPTSNAALWMISSAPSTNARKSSQTSANFGLSARNASVRPCTLTASSWLGRSGFT